MGGENPRVENEGMAYILCFSDKIVCSEKAKAPTPKPTERSAK